MASDREICADVGLKTSHYLAWALGAGLSSRVWSWRCSAGTGWCWTTSGTGSSGLGVLVDLRRDTAAAAKSTSFALVHWILPWLATPAARDRSQWPARLQIVPLGWFPPPPPGLGTREIKDTDTLKWCSSMSKSRLKQKVAPSIICGRIFI